MERSVVLVFTYLLLQVLTGSNRALAQAPGEPSEAAMAVAQKCAALAQVSFEDLPGAPAKITVARMQELTTAELQAVRDVISAPAPSSHIKQYCQVLGYVAPQNKFELRLPLASEWNQKFYFSACAGFCGSVNGSACNAGLARGYASATGNGGHDSAPGFDGLWAAGAPELQEDYGWRSNHVVTIAAKAITTQYYGQPIQRSYMSGCSKGGQAVLMEAQRFPEDFDALLPIAPVYDLAGRAMAHAWLAQADSDGDRGSVLNPASADAAHKSVLAMCGAQTGVDIGLVTEPLSCNWKPEMIACPSGVSRPDCLSPPQVASIKRLMAPTTNSKGKIIFAYPYIPGAETQWVGWNFSGVAVSAPSGAAAFYAQGANSQVADQFLKYLADAQPRDGVDPLKFNFDRDPATLSRARKIYDATSYDLRAFKARGGKILMWHGLADGGIPATSSIGYYVGVMKAMGGREKTEDFFRLFLVPGVHHCFGGPGLTGFDALTLLENWVERGQAPTVLIAQRMVHGSVERSLPIYPYPRIARYSGNGDPKQASSFVLTDPSKK